MIQWLCFFFLYFASSYFLQSSSSSSLPILELYRSYPNIRSIPDYFMIYLSLFWKISAFGLYFVICLNYFLQSTYSGYFFFDYELEEDDDDEEEARLGFFWGTYFVVFFYTYDFYWIFLIIFYYFTSIFEGRSFYFTTYLIYFLGFSYILVIFSRITTSGYF
jgi:hypothetical protein